ncbi:MAG: twin-arginine translocation signal domain-containing protein, partial [Proteobacteria bacterium]|nr:twin-arginine translocation signal domain-containing protein [Pseudomonadota bacterium]
MVGSTKHSRLKTNSGTSSKTLVTRRRVLQGAAATGAAITTFNILRPLAAQAAQSDQLIIAIPNTPPRADPHFIDQFIEHELLDNIGSRLVEWTSTVRPNGFRVQVLEGIAPIEPLLAESWEQSEDKLTYTLGLALLGLGLAPDPVSGLIVDAVVVPSLGTSLLSIRNPAEPDAPSVQLASKFSKETSVIRVSWTSTVKLG